MYVCVVCQLLLQDARRALKSIVVCISRTSCLEGLRYNFNAFTYIQQKRIRYLTFSRLTYLLQLSTFLYLSNYAFVAMPYLLIIVRARQGVLLKSSLFRSQTHLNSQLQQDRQALSSPNPSIPRTLCLELSFFLIASCTLNYISLYAASIAIASIIESVFSIPIILQNRPLLLLLSSRTYIQYALTSQQGQTPLQNMLLRPQYSRTLISLVDLVYLIVMPQKQLLQTYSILLTCSIVFAAALLRSSLVLLCMLAFLSVRQLFPTVNLL